MRASERQLLAQEAARLGSSLGDDQVERLALYVEVLRTWNERVRLLGDRDPQVLIRKHIPDCLALVRFLPAVGPLADLGSGAGLPGMVLACVRIDLECWLIESRRRRASFLHAAKASLGLGNVRVVEGRAENVSGDPSFASGAEMITARAVSLQELLRLGLPLIRSKGRLLAMQSQRWTVDETRLVARQFEVEILDCHEYRLLDGERRRLVILGRT